MVYTKAAMERAMKVQEVILRAISKQIHWFEAAKILGLSARQLRRLYYRYKNYGYDGLYDRRSGKPSPRRVPLGVAEQVFALYREKYFDFSVRHFHEKLWEEHGILLSYSWVKLALQGAGLVDQARQRGVHRRRRERRPMVGMMLHIDGSRHRWLGGEQWHDLIVVLDDASSEIYYAQLVEEESTVTVLTALREVVEQRGIFCSLYSDRGSHFWLTPKAGEMVDRQRLTQVGRAMRELGIEMIPAYSPQARGRSERNFGTWQRRLPQELRLRGIRTREEANRFLRESYIAEFNRKFAVAAQPESAFVPVGGKDLERIFTLQHERVVNRDNTISFANRVLQIERTRWRGTLAGCRVVMCEHLDGSLTVYYGPHVVGRFAGPEQEGKAGAESCGKDAALGNPAKDAGFPLSHSSNNSLPFSIQGEEKPKASGHTTC